MILALSQFAGEGCPVFRANKGIDALSETMFRKK